MLIMINFSEIICDLLKEIFCFHWFKISNLSNIVSFFSKYVFLAVIVLGIR